MQLVISSRHLQLTNTATTSSTWLLARTILPNHLHLAAMLLTHSEAHSAAWFFIYHVLEKHNVV